MLHTFFGVGCTTRLYRACAAAFKAASCVAEVTTSSRADLTSAFMAASSEVIDIS